MSKYASNPIILFITGALIALASSPFIDSDLLIIELLATGVGLFGNILSIYGFYLGIRWIYRKVMKKGTDNSHNNHG